MNVGRCGRVVTAALLMLLLADEHAMAARLDALAADGLYSWRVAATDDAPAWCCLCWANSSPATRACDLDGRHAGYGITDGLPAGDGAMQIYALIESGKTRRLRVLSPLCETTARREVVDLGVVEVDESLAWLKPHVTAHTQISGEALAAIAVHSGSAALQFLIDTADSGPMELRKDAIFWMSQARIAESAGKLERLMFGDESAAIRQHAAFSVSQSTAANRSEALIRQGRGDRDPEVRSQAWFWLAQTGASESESVIRRAITDDPDPAVRREAVFAMSQLPGERGVDALFAVLRNRQMHRDVREQALFWLAQSDSDRAFEYLDRLLAGRQ